MIMLLNEPYNLTCRLNHACRQGNILDNMHEYEGFIAFVKKL